MPITWTVRDADFDDLPELEWTGGQSHLRAIAGDLAKTPDEKQQLVVQLSNGRLVAHGAVDFVRHPGAGVIMMLAVHPVLQSLGLGTVLIAALEERAASQGCRQARIGVEHDNPRAAALYRRLGYRVIGDEVDHWEEGHGRTYVTVCTVLSKELEPLR